MSRISVALALDTFAAPAVAGPGTTCATRRWPAPAVPSITAVSAALAHDAGAER